MDSLARECGCQVRRLDVTDAQAITTAAKEVGAIQVLFNGAGFVHAGTVLEASEADWDLAFDLNVRSMARTIRAFLPGMLAQGGGSIVNIASVAGSVKGVPNRFVYGATKAAVIGLTKAVAADFVTRGIRCNAICPGTVDSPSLRRAHRARRRRPAARPKTRSCSSSWRASRWAGWARADEIAALAVYLASDEAAFTTGSVHDRRRRLVELIHVSQGAIDHETACATVPRAPRSPA